MMPEPGRDDRFPRSRAIAERARRVVWKGGSEATQHPSLIEAGFPRYLARGEGARVWDADGNAYLDYLMSWGSVLLGHRAPAVEAAVRRQLEEGALFNLAVEGEVALAERLVRHVPAAELVRFVASGSEATAAAVRVARAATGRETVVQFGFHGWLDWCQGAHPAGVPPATLSAVLPMEYNDLDALAALFAAHRDGIACVLMEPVKDEEPAAGFLSGVRELTHANGALLVFDEVKTGLRLGLGGAQVRLGVTPDLCTLSKALANGYPLAALAGRREVFERASEVWISGTYHGWPPAVAAAHATLTELETEPVVERVASLGRRLMDGFARIAADRGLRGRLAGLPALPQIRCPAGERPWFQALFGRMVGRGYFIHPLRPWFPSAAHGEGDVERTLADLEEAARGLERP